MTVDDGYTVPPFVRRLRSAARERGRGQVALELARYATGALTGLRFTGSGSHGQFEFQGRRYGYLHDRYKRSWLTERAVEVPIVSAVVEEHAGRRVLEVGNVLSHYRPHPHTVLDKYEHAPGVLNRDVLDLAGLGPFDLIAAISTLEHVGWDENPRDPDKTLAAVGALRDVLAPGGRLMLTVPIGYNPSFDQHLREGRIELAGVGALMRVGGSGRWREVAAADVWSAPYDFLLYRANGVLVGFVER
jgi:SAM-dependent methyltransferase